MSQTSELASNWVVFFSCPWNSLENITEELSSLPGFLGNEELPSEGAKLFETSEEFEVLEFGSEAAIKCAEWLESGDFQNKSELAYVKSYFEGEFPEGSTFINCVEAKLSNPNSRILKSDSFQEISWLRLPDQDYLENYKKSVKGQSFGKNLWVGPPWEEPPEGKTNFFVEPGMAFGTGDHPTTQMCLEFLEELSNEFENNSKQESLSLKSSHVPVYDVGTGTGILALAVKKFFPERELVLTDLDPLCGNEIQKTFELNKTSLENVKMVLGPQADLKKIELNAWPKSDLLISNIYAEVLVDILPELAAITNPGGYWVVSGLLQGPASVVFDDKASEFFELVGEKSTTLEEAKLDTKQGLNTKRHTWLARLFKRR